MHWIEADGHCFFYCILAAADRERSVSEADRRLFTSFPNINSWSIIPDTHPCSFLKLIHFSAAGADKVHSESCWILQKAFIDPRERLWSTSQSSQGQEGVRKRRRLGGDSWHAWVCESDARIMASIISHISDIYTGRVPIVVHEQNFAEVAPNWQAAQLYGFTYNDLGDRIAAQRKGWIEIMCSRSEQHCYLLSPYRRRKPLL